MEINKALELGLEWAEKRIASELTEMDKEYILTGIKASLVKNCSIPDVVGQSEQLCDHIYFDNTQKNNECIYCGNMREPISPLVYKLQYMANSLHRIK